jgi:hypothetical protein
MRAGRASRAFFAIATALAPVVLLALPSAALADRWLPPVPGEVSRAFAYSRADPFAPGAHRGIDLGARPGTVVRAACAGRVLHAGRVAGADAVVSLHCGGRRVSHLPLARVSVRTDSTVRAGAPLGTLAPGHDGLHLGVRRDGDPFGYEDPAGLLPAARPVLPVVAPRSRPRSRPPRAARPRSAPSPALRAPLRPPAPSPSPAPVTAPWAAWAGLALLLAGATGSGTALAVRRRRSRRPVLATASWNRSSSL